MQWCQLKLKQPSSRLLYSNTPTTKSQSVIHNPGTDKVVMYNRNHEPVIRGETQCSRRVIISCPTCSTDHDNSCPPPFGKNFHSTFSYMKVPDTFICRQKLFQKVNILPDMILIFRFFSQPSDEVFCLYRLLFL